MQSNIKVIIENFRAIGHATIQISGITIVTGENSSGKSTLSKLLYELFNTVTNYEILVKEELMREFSNLFQFFEIVYTDSKDILDRKEYSKIVYLSHEYYYKNKPFEEIKNLLSVFLSEIYNKIDIAKSNRYNYIISNILGDGIDNTLENIISFINQKIEKAIDKVHSRPISLFTEKLLNVFRDKKLPKSFEVLEEKEVIVSLEKPTLSIPFSVQKAIYIDSPMSLGAGSSSNKHWSDLTKFIFFENKNISDFYNNDIYTSISKNIKGEAVKFTLGTLSTLTFLREDGKEFELTEVATGIKAFSIIQILLKNGHIDNRTLLIIDEPESHLHPQWIVEYARMIVLLHKHIGVKFFLASHNPDMVSAIRYIAEKEGVLDNVNYYLAEKEEETYLYNYRSLGTEIDPIFASFNIALDRINQYSLPYKDEEIQ